MPDSCTPCDDVQNVKLEFHGSFVDTAIKKSGEDKATIATLQTEVVHLKHIVYGEVSLIVSILLVIAGIWIKRKFS